MTRGRKREAGKRWGNGRLAPKEERIVIPKEVLERRADLVGRRYAMQPEAGYALGQAFLIGLIDRRQHDAGLAFRHAWQRWASLAGLPPHEMTQRTGRMSGDVDEDIWQRVRNRFMAAADALEMIQPRRLVWVAVECVVMDDVLPPSFPERYKAVAALKAGLSALGDHFGLPDDQTSGVME